MPSVYFVGSLVLLFLLLHPKPSCPIDCQPGQVGLATDTSCTVCGAGKYAASTGQRDCTLCPAGKYLYDGATSASLHDSLHDCSDCSIGRYSSSAGQTICSICSSGQYTSETLDNHNAKIVLLVVTCIVREIHPAHMTPKMIAPNASMVNIQKQMVQVHVLLVPQGVGAVLGLLSVSFVGPANI